MLSAFNYYADIYVFIGRVVDIRHSQLSSSSLQTECTTTRQDLHQLSYILHEFVQLYGENALQIEDSSNGPDRLLQCLVTPNGLRGRPAYIISKVQLETLIDLGFNCGTIARMFGVSERTLLRRRIEYDLPIGAMFTDISDNNLDIAVRNITQVCNYYKIENSGDKVPKKDTNEGIEAPKLSNTLYDDKEVWTTLNLCSQLYVVVSLFGIPSLLRIY